MYNVGQINCCLNVGHFDGACFDTVIHSQSRPIIVLVEIMNCSFVWVKRFRVIL
jgi:hypothetical protein